MKIFRLADRLVMVTETAEHANPQQRFSSEASVVWEREMDQFQQQVIQDQRLPKWQEPSLIFDLSDSLKGYNQ